MDYIYEPILTIDDEILSVPCVVENIEEEKQNEKFVINVAPIIKENENTTEEKQNEKFVIDVAPIIKDTEEIENDENIIRIKEAYKEYKNMIDYFINTGSRIVKSGMYSTYSNAEMYDDLEEITKVAEFNIYLRGTNKIKNLEEKINFIRDLRFYILSQDTRNIKSPSLKELVATYAKFIIRVISLLNTFEIRNKKKKIISLAVSNFITV